MDDSPLQKLVTQVQAHFSIHLPVSGGMGSTLSDAVILDIDNANLIAPLEHAVLHYLTLFRGHNYEVVNTELEEGERVIEKIKTTFSNDPIRFHSYYFDITRPWKSNSKPLTISGNPYFPDSELTIYSDEQENSPETN